MSDILKALYFELHKATHQINIIELQLFDKMIAIQCCNSLSADRWSITTNDFGIHISNDNKFGLLDGETIEYEKPTMIDDLLQNIAIRVTIFSMDLNKYNKTPELLIKAKEASDNLFEFMKNSIKNFYNCMEVTVMEPI